jgi:hypothetical protein
MVQRHSVSQHALSEEGLEEELGLEARGHVGCGKHEIALVRYRVVEWSQFVRVLRTRERESARARASEELEGLGIGFGI